MSGPCSSPRIQQSKGSAIIEVAFLAPWIFFLMIGALDMGFYCHSLIAVENAARIAAERTSQGSTYAASQTTACTAALNELSGLPNMGSVSSCSAAPLTVTASSITGPDGGAATSVTVTYQGLQMIPIPGLLIGRLNISRNVQTRVKAL